VPIEVPFCHASRVVVGENGQTFCLSGARGDDARREFEVGPQMVWTVEAASHGRRNRANQWYLNSQWGVELSAPVVEPLLGVRVLA
jgi:hypothetical protein